MKSREIIKMIESGTPLMEKRRPEASGPQTSGSSGYKINSRPVAIGDVKQRSGDQFCRSRRHCGEYAKSTY